MEMMLRRLWRTSFRHGLAGDGWPWLLLGGAAYLAHRTRRPPAAVRETLTLSPGESAVVQVSAPLSRRRRGASA